MWNLDARNKKAITVFSAFSSPEEQRRRQGTLDRETRRELSDNEDNRRRGHAHKVRKTRYQQPSNQGQGD